MPHLIRDYGGNLRFSGQAATVKCFENNPLVRKVCHRLHGMPARPCITEGTPWPHSDHR